MKTKLLFLCLLFGILSLAQTVMYGNNTPLQRSEWYIPWQPSNDVGNRNVIAYQTGDKFLYFSHDSVRLDALSGSGMRVVVASPQGTFKTKLLSDFYPSTNPNGYISSYTETDPIWLSVSGNYRTKTQNDGLYYSISNPSGYLTSVPSQTWASITGKPTTLLGYGITDAYPLSGNPSGFLTGITSGQVTSALGYTPYNGATNPNNYITASAITKTINNNVSRTLNSNYTISSTKDAMVSYSISLSVTNPLLAGSSSASAFLEYSTDGGTTWITVSQVINSSSVALAVTIALTQPNTFVVSGVVPANGLVRIRTTTSGTATATYGRGQEVLF